MLGIKLRTNPYRINLNNNNANDNPARRAKGCVKLGF